MGKIDNDTVADNVNTIIIKIIKERNNNGKSYDDNDTLSDWLIIRC